MPCNVTTTTTTTTTTTPAPEVQIPCPLDYAITGGPIDHNVTGSGFIIDIEVRTDSNINSVFYAQYPATPGSPIYCDYQPTITIQRGQCVVFQQKDISNGSAGFTNEANTLYIATSLDGSPGSYEYTQGISYRMGETTGGTYIPGCDVCAEDECANILWCVEECTPDKLYYRSRTNDNMGGVILIEGDADCDDVTGCSEHERPFNEILPLVLSDTFYEWYEATNEIITAINPLKVYDITLRGGLREKWNQAGDLHIEVDAGEGLRVWPPDPVTGTELSTECWDGKIRLDFFGLTDASPTGGFEPFEDGATGSPVNDDDLYAFERMLPYQGVFPEDIAGGFFKVKAENMLPHTIAGNHRFTGLVTFENPVTDISSTKVVIDDINIELGVSSYMEMVVEATVGDINDLEAGTSHDVDGDGQYYESGGVTGEILEQIHRFFDTTVDDLTDVTGSETSKATILEVNDIDGSQATLKLRAYNDIPFNTTDEATTTRSGLTLQILSFSGQSGTDVDIDGGGITLVSSSSDGNKTIEWKNDYNAWEINQNFKIDSTHAFLTPFNITNENQGDVSDITNNSHWNVHQYINEPLPQPIGCTGCDILNEDYVGLLHFSYFEGGENEEVATLSLLPCGGIYIHNIECSPQFSIETSPCNIVVSNQYGILDKSQAERMFYPTSDLFSLGDVVRVVDGQNEITGAQADSADNAEVLGIVVQLITGGPQSCGTQEQGVLIAYGGEIDWQDGWAGLSTPLTKGAIYYLDPITGGNLTEIEPLDVAEIRKPMVLAVDDNKVLIVNYEGVINGDYFDENPVTRLTELRDVTTTNPVGGDILYYDGNSNEWVNEPVHVASGNLSASAVVTGSVTGGGSSSFPESTTATLTFSGAYPYTSLPSNQVCAFRGTFVLYDYDVTGNTGGIQPEHEVGEFAGAFFNLDDTNTTGSITGSIGFGVEEGGSNMSNITEVNWGMVSGNKAIQIEGSSATIDYTNGDIILSFDVQSSNAHSRNFGMTAWIDFLGTDELPPT
jgi:hypothetical protein